MTNKEFIFGYETFSGKPFTWNPKKVVNPHGMIVAGSGAGKTYTIKNFVENMANPIRFHVLDVHGDIEFDEDICSTVYFSETSDIGLNPLVVSADVEFGGVRRAINGFIKMIESTSRKLGEKQLPTLRNILEDVYVANGFLVSDPKTWSLDYDIRTNQKFKKKHPTLEDVIRYTRAKLQQTFVGSNSKGCYFLEKLNQSVVQLNRKYKKSINDEEVDLIKEKEKCIEFYGEYVNNIETGKELEDLMKYDSAEVLKRILEKLEELKSSGIFKNNAPVFDNNKFIWRYNIKTLSDDELKMFTDVLLKKIYFNSKSSGLKDSVVDIIINDEAHKVTSDDSEHIINVILKEARKFGLGWWGASQSFSHFSDDILESTASKLLLNIDEMYQESSAKKLRFDVKNFKYMILHKSGFINIKNKGVSSKFENICFREEDTDFKKKERRNYG